MIRFKTCFVAEGVITDRETNQVSAFGLMESVQAPNFPVVLQRVALLCIWERLHSDPPEFGVELTLTLNGRELERTIINVSFAQFLRTRTTVRLEGLTLAEPGSLVFRLAISGHDTAEWTLDASRTPASAPDAVRPAAANRAYVSDVVTISTGNVNVHRK